jgi:hypothetical protein
MPPELVGGGGKAAELEGDTATTGVLVLSLPKSNSASNPGSDENFSSGGALGKPTNASLKSVRPTFTGSGGIANGEVAAAKALAFCVGAGGNGLL